MPKKPFSGKAKKAQLAAKKNKQLGKLVGGKGNLQVLQKDGQYSRNNSAYTDVEVRKESKSRYELQFKKQTPEELRLSKEKAMLPLLRNQDCTARSEMYFDNYHDFPQRPTWNGAWSKEKLEMNEQRVFRQYITRLLKSDIDVPRPVREKGADDTEEEEEEEDADDREEESEVGDGDHENPREDAEEDHDSHPGVVKEFSYFELNLETWRQLWRVLEKSDILLIILDVRYAAATFPPSLYNYILSKGKQLIVVLNKIDLIPSPLVAAWKNYFTTTYPGVHIVYFTSFPAYNMVGVRENKRGLKIRKKKTLFSIVTEASQQIYDICEKLYGDKVDLSSWQKKIEGSKDHETRVVHETYDHTKDTEMKEGTLTIGTLGHPNVGKSSLINSLCGKKVVSVSRTPGHTKHFQTIFLTKTVRLCDCPGLVFPSKAPRQLQVLMGSFPIAQLREPYSVVQLLAERVDLPKLLDLQLPSDEKEWSAFLICEAFAVKKGFTTARTSRPDSYRAANMILRFALDGRICLTYHPPNYKEENWKNHPDAFLAEEVTARKRAVESEYLKGGEGLSGDGARSQDDDEDRDDEQEEEEEEYDEDEDKSDEENDEYDTESDDDDDDDTVMQSGSKNPFALLSND
ncbi:guanine nucleotide-binding protein-like 1 [Eurytemora carolleeae]|uniref:guanine nucleotide-binding protein-like 1 n=1 Tax=Eurytemora carolleeae TaxID=1294199 RepID=UPI000C7698BD|nr:guanine nucleotide-binding protein-like 1 [Eurytemora carolleeae]|eukprot:XP_023336867.1 guanine nucleotide-binding protein-like 1 [Eurytemora affinis]